MTSERFESLRFNYYDIFFSYYFNNEIACTKMIHDHMLVYVYSGELMLEEGVYSLLSIDQRFYPALFDFTEPWKIDILDYMEDNYMFDLSVEQIAGFTGRSLAAFKRDFKKISQLSPQRWLMDKRLKVAHDKIRNENRKVSDVYLEVGFKNLSHFSIAYKKQFGVAPSK